MVRGQAIRTFLASAAFCADTQGAALQPKRSTGHDQTAGLSRPSPVSGSTVTVASGSANTSVPGRSVDGLHSVLTASSHVTWPSSLAMCGSLEPTTCF